MKINWHGDLNDDCHAEHNGTGARSGTTLATNQDTAKGGAMALSTKTTRAGLSQLNGAKRMITDLTNHDLAAFLERCPECRPEGLVRRQLGIVHDWTYLGRNIDTFCLHALIEAKVMAAWLTLLHESNPDDNWVINEWFGDGYYYAASHVITDGGSDGHNRGKGPTRLAAIVAAYEAEVNHA